MLHYTYRIDNLINGKYYIGKHSSESLDDKYMGSGPLIKAAIAKYGIKNFKKTILKTFSTSEEAFEHEAQIVTMAEVNDPMCYNVQPGGKGKQKLFTDEELREHALEQQREYRQQNKERILEYHKEHHQQNKEQHRERMKEHYQQNKEQYRERQKGYYQQNKEQYREYKREYMKEYRRKKREQKKKMKQMKTI